MYIHTYVLYYFVQCPATINVFIQKKKDKNPGKRKRVVVSIEQKIEAIRRVDRGETLVQVCDDYGVSANTVGDWRRNRQNLENFFKSHIGDRKSMKNPDFPKTNEATYVWFQQQRNKGMSLSGPIIQAKAEILAKKFPEEAEKFKASEGWLHRFKERFGIRQLSLSGEKLSADEEAATLFCDELRTVMTERNYSLDQVYNCDETGLYFKLLPSKTLASAEESNTPGTKKKKDRITVLLCANASGTHRLQLMVIGKSAKPRALNKIPPKNLPVFYKNQKSAWMDRDLFKLWFDEEFVPQVQNFLKSKDLPEKALLLLDNAPSHPNEEILQCGEITAMFLPANVTSLIQPMDQGAIESFKRRYTKLLLQELLLKFEDEDLETRVKSVTIKNAIYWAAEAWKSVKESTLNRVWSPLLDLDEKGDLVEHENEVAEIASIIQNIPGGENVQVEDINQWMREDDHEFAYTDDEIVELIQKNDKEKQSKESDDDGVPGAEIDTVSYAKAYDAFETALKFLEQQESATPMDLAVVKKWYDYTALKRVSTSRQKLLTSYFTRE